MSREVRFTLASISVLLIASGALLASVGFFILSWMMLAPGALLLIGTAALTDETMNRLLQQIQYHSSTGRKGSNGL